MSIIAIDITRIKELACRAIAPIKPVDKSSSAEKDFLFNGKRAVSGSDLPPPYFIYFLLVELLGFRDLGKFEKLAWSIPIDFNGKAFLIEHRKFGVGVFIQHDTDIDDAKRIGALITKGVRCAKPYFKWKAEEAVRASKFNVANNGRILFDRYEYLTSQFTTIHEEALARKDEVITTQHSPLSWTSYRPSFQLNCQARWLALAAIDAFFSWTEHVFIHIAILNSKIEKGEDFTVLSSADWATKYKAALDISDKSLKNHFDKLTALRRQLRNFLAHGAFGKDGETLYFHSNAGAVPVLFDVTARKDSFSVGENLEFDVEQAFATIKSFIDILWDGSRKPAWIYIQDWGLPLIMTMARDGTYQNAMTSPENMEEFARHLAQEMDNSANMDW